MIGAQLQKAIYEALTAEPPIAAGEVYDGIPEGANFPRIIIGEDQVLDDGDSCSDGWEINADIHVWSRSPDDSFAEAKDLAAAVAARVRGIDAVDGFTIIEHSIENQRALRDPDGKTRRIVQSYRFLLDPA